LEETNNLVLSLEEANLMQVALQDCAVNPTSTNIGFIAKVLG
jgi:hypothetical protein